MDEVPRSETPMIAGRRYCGMLRNQFESVPYALAKSEVATRITRAMRDGRGDIVAEDLTRLDSGALAEDKLFALFTPGTAAGAQAPNQRPRD